jgi:glycosyltransferase involved in cell wall biosynthesis
MHIGVYIEHGSGKGVGGAELMVACLAKAWADDHEVDLVHHRPPLTRERMSAFSGEHYDRVTFRYVPRETDPPAFRNPYRRYRAAREWYASLSRPYDLFVNCTHWLPCFCHARRGALLVLFPFYIRPCDTPQFARLPAWKRWRYRAYHDIEWERRLVSYSRAIAISNFASEWTRRRWGIGCEVVFPPVDTSFAPGPKEPLVLSVGRFATQWHTKKQLEMVRTFREIHATTRARWSYACVGGLNGRDENQAYFARVADLARGSAAQVQANVPPAELRQLFRRASIFWHATGFDNDTDARPELAEHFGIATVEAMAAGCVPVVVNKGGQREIVQHGVTGFLWNTLAELKAYTTQLMEDETLRRRMSEAGRERAKLFSRERFIARVSAICGVAYAQGGDTVGAAALPRAVAL